MATTSSGVRPATGPRAFPEGKRLRDRLVGHEDWLIDRVLAYARARGYTAYTSTLREAWRLSIAGLTESLAAALDAGAPVPELSPDEACEHDPIAAFGVLEAKRHRERGVRLDMFLGLMKYYCQAYTDLVDEAGWEPDVTRSCRLFVTRFFDKVELGFLSEWTALSGRDVVDELQVRNRTLTNEKNKYLTIFESISSPVLLFAADGRLANLNHTAVELFVGEEPPGSFYYGNEWQKRCPWIGPVFREHVRPDVAESTFELKVLTTRGMRSFEGKVARMLDVSEKFSGHIMILSDVTDREQARRELQEARDSLDLRVRERTRELEQANAQLRAEVEERLRVEEEKERVQEQLLHAQKMEAIGTLAGGVAHDLNNLLQIIMGCSQLAGLCGLDDPRVPGWLEDVLHAGNTATGLVRQLLLFSRKQELRFELLDINQTVGGLSKMLGRIIGGNVRIETDLDPALALTRADAGCVEQILVNLAVNARDAMPDGGTITIRTANVTFEEGDGGYPGATAGPYVMVSVRDTGCGMDEATLARVFEPFFTTKEVGKGTGLGLSVVYGIVQKHGGWVHAYSQLGTGTVLNVYLPAAPPAEAALAPHDEPLSGLRGHGERILLVEDEKRIRAYVTSALEASGYEVLGASTAAEGLELLQSRSREIDCVLSDVVLQGPSGVKMIESALEARPDLIVLYMSGYPDLPAATPSPRAGGFPLLPKPFSVRQLLSALREALHGVRPPGLTPPAAPAAS